MIEITNGSKLNINSKTLYIKPIAGGASLKINEDGEEMIMTEVDTVKYTIKHGDMEHEFEIRLKIKENK